uniref:Uncharacterized protein n=1 Tax=Glossina palpalis gambiensis TaxID=67801 RepID=A0A1B0B0W8_9MUSC
MDKMHSKENFLDGFSNAAESCSLFRTMFFFSKPMSVCYFRPLQSHRTSGGNPPKLSLHIMSGDRDNVTKQISSSYYFT